MLDDTEKPDRPTLTPKIKAEPQPLCTVMTDCSIRFESDLRVTPLDLQRMLLSAAANVTAQVMQRSMLSERLLAKISAGFDGLDDETQRAINTVLNS